MLNRSASLAMSTLVLKALPGKLDIKYINPDWDSLIVCFHGKTVLEQNYWQENFVCFVALPPKSTAMVIA